MLKGLYARSRKLIAGAILCAAVAVPMLAPKPALAWWGPGWGWHGGWHAGVFVGVPPVVIGPPVYAPAAYPYPYPYPYAAPLPYWRWVPAHWNAAGVLVGGHWEHR